MRPFLLLEKHDKHFLTFGGLKNKSEMKKEMLEIEGLGADQSFLLMLSRMRGKYL